MKVLRIVTLALMLSPCFAATPNGSGYDGPDQASFQEAVKWIRSQVRIHTEYDYVMTVRLRLLFFWVKRDDVGGGYVRLGDVAEEPRLQVVQLLFGSDPAKTPHAINRWGAATEIVRRLNPMDCDPATSVFFGFMKPSKGGSASAMQSELFTEGTQGQHLFEATISRVDPGRALYVGVPFYSERDFNLNELPQAEQAVMSRLNEGPDRKFRRLEGPSQLQCERVNGFLSTILELIDESLKVPRRTAPLCYVYDAHQYTAGLTSVHTVAQRTIRVVRREGGPGIDQTYRDLREAHFRVRRLDTGRESDFDILVGASGPLRGVPIQISYQPNWWFQVVLNLKEAPLHPEPLSNQAGRSAKALQVPGE
jgi:hypothetical protein